MDFHTSWFFSFFLLFSCLVEFPVSYAKFFSVECIVPRFSCSPQIVPIPEELVNKHLAVVIFDSHTIELAIVIRTSRQSFILFLFSFGRALPKAHDESQSLFLCDSYTVCDFPCCFVRYRKTVLGFFKCCPMDMAVLGGGSYCPSSFQPFGVKETCLLTFPCVPLGHSSDSSQTLTSFLSLSM